MKKIYKVDSTLYEAESKKEVANYLGIKESKVTLSDSVKESKPISIAVEVSIKRQIEEALFSMNLIQNRNPTRIFNIGEKVRIGLKSYTVVENIQNQLYVIQETPERDTARVVNWYEIYKNNIYEDSFENNQLQLNFSNIRVESLFVKYYHFGVNMNPDYQRDLVWTLEQKRDLIASIEAGLDIGKFVFVHKKFKYGEPDYEVLDGKQRLSALIDFYEDRFTYKEKYFSELSVNDRRRVKEHGILIATIKETDKASIVNYFVKLNSTGTPVEKKFLESLKQKYNMKG